MSAHGEAYAPKSRALLTDSTGVRRVVILHKVSDVSAYLVRTSAGARLTVPGSQLHPTETEARKRGVRKVIDMSASRPKCSCARHADGSVTTFLCPVHADTDPCLTTSRVTGRRRTGTIKRGRCTACGHSSKVNETSANPL